jgi:hypothetical protein
MPFSFLAAMARSAWARVRGYEIFADGETVMDRQDQCVKCEFFDGEQCSVCGCLIAAKTVLALEQCPKKKWPRIWIARKRQN